MINHSGIAVSSSEVQTALFEDVFSLQPFYSFEIEENIISTLFGLKTRAVATVYDCGNSRIEVFVPMDAAPCPGQFNHICLSFPDRQPVIRRAQAAGYEIRRFTRQDGKVIFLVDGDGNLYELKNR